MCCFDFETENGNIKRLENSENLSSVSPYMPDNKEFAINTLFKNIGHCSTLEVL
jgi:hypothetical protein